MNTIPPLREQLQDWTDWDGAELALFRVLFQNNDDFATTLKHIFWSDNPVGNFLDNVLDGLVNIGVLETREKPTDLQYRWNPNFKGSWEQKDK